MPERCTFRFENRKFCRRWPVKGTRFCLGHTTVPSPDQTDADENLSPLDRLNTHDDLFDVVRESLNAIRLGRLSPGRAYATGYFIDLWMRVRERMEKAGPETKTFQKRRSLSNPVEQAMFDVVAEKVVQLMTGKTPEDIERNHGALNEPGEPHWGERKLPADNPVSKALFNTDCPHPPWVPPSSAAAQPSPLPKNWGYEKEEKAVKGESVEMKK
jgi:hypothetical protein